MTATIKSHNDIGFCVHSLHADLENHFSWLHEHGIRCIAGACWPGQTEDVIRKMDRLMEKFEMRMASLHGWVALLSSDGNDDRLKPAYAPLFELAKRWKAEAIVLHYGDLAQDAKPAVWWSNTDYIAGLGLKEFGRRQSRMAEWICGEASKSNTVIALENLTQFWPYSYDVAEMAETIRGWNIPNLGICFDNGHANLGDINPAQALSSLGKTVVTTHLHDNYGWKGPRSANHIVDLHLPPGLGTIDWRALLLAFRKSDYRGPYIFEVETKETVWDMTLENWAAFETLADKAAESS